MQKIAYLLVNFGGPRSLSEIEEFLIELLNDQEVIRTRLPAFVHRFLFTRIAKKRSSKIAPDYAMIGGKSPIFEDTEEIARRLAKSLGQEVIVFHRYLPKTHSCFLETMKTLSDVDEVRVFPLFPQFSYATTGSIALWFAKHLKKQTVDKLRWVKSYPGDPSYIQALESTVRQFLESQGLQEQDTLLLCSAHGLPQRFIDTGDAYEKECRLTFNLLKERFPKASSLLSFQSQFGKEEWIRPYTAEVCEKICQFTEGRKQVVVVPLSFTSDHIETLYEIEKIYLESIRKNGLDAFRCPALNLREDWVEAIAAMFLSEKRLNNSFLIRNKKPA